MPASSDLAPLPAVTEAATVPTGPSTNGGSLGTLAVRCAADIVATEVRWLWDQRLVYGKLNVLGGPPGVGKSFLTCALAAAVSRGERLPGDLRSRGPSRRVVLLSYEDDPEDTIRPRLDLVGADLERVELVEGVNVDEGRRAFGPADVALLRVLVADRDDVGLVVVDPVSAFVGPDTDEHRGNEVRAALDALRLSAQEYGFAVLLVMHTRKAIADTALNRLAGSAAYGQLVRSVLMAGSIRDHPQGWRALAHAKHNLSPKQPTLAYEVTESGLVWHGEVEIDADEVAGNSGAEARSAMDEAKAFLVDTLADGPVASTDVLEEAAELGISERTLKRAKAALEVDSVKEGDRWYWIAPT